jgi:hypothetical protein
MSAAIRAALPYGVAIVLSAAPILAIVLLMVTSRPTRISLLFLLGWAAGIATVASLIVAFVDTSVPRGGPSTLGAVVKILLGVTLGVLAVRSWMRRTGAGPPGWMSGVMGWSPSRALSTGFALGSVNPKNLALVTSGAASILEATSIPFEQAAAIAVLAAVASLGIAAPIALKAVGGQAVSGGLERAATWMKTHGKAISAIVLSIIAVVLIAKGVAGLTGK